MTAGLGQPGHRRRGRPAAHPVAGPRGSRPVGRGRPARRRRGATLARRVTGSQPAGSRRSAFARIASWT
jgi:hypothetical protein